MAIKLIATDLNGTLLHDDQSFNQAMFTETLAELTKHNVKLVLSSGNQFAHLRELFADVLTPELGIIAENGASIYHDNQLVFDGSLTASQLQTFVETDRFLPCLKGAYIILTGAKGSYTEIGVPQQLIDAAEKFYDNLHQVTSLQAVTDKIKKISVSVLPGQAAQLVQSLNTALAGRLVAHDSGYGVVDLVTTNVGKLPAVQWLARHWHIQAEEIMAFGDGANDVPLLQFAGQGVAMKNAPVEIQRTGNLISEWSNQEDGVLKTIQQVIAKLA
ncbi:Cof-type HAD-IIB family hydrolase [Levilactobacillus yonginensis]|uniref:Cof-type HAD-IIB family hydrolase n=1 Tax=Levilactobacillus yonginensis TaxID=1054041 RepID=UPI000F7853F7|nr:Cof-type HAD-IIB family hydrolase [Levilactobacillus yonginensis]